MGDYVISDIPLRMDKLKFGLWHTLISVALGISWIMDGLEVTTIGLISAQLQDPKIFGIKNAGVCGTIYMVGVVTGSLFFGYLSDRIGRKKLFIVIPSIYLCSTLVTALVHHKLYLFVCLLMTGFGIGGEYSAMNSAINEFIPAAVRGTVDLIINGSYWLGACIGGMLCIYFLNPDNYDADVGWRLPFFMCGIIGIVVIVLRLFLPESPRWLLAHNQVRKAEEIVRGIEKRCGVVPGPAYGDGDNSLNLGSADRAGVVRIAVGKEFGFKDIAGTLLGRKYRSRSLLGLTLMLAQAYFYNGIFFTFSAILRDCYDVVPSHAGYYIIPFAIGNFLGSVSIGRLFDTVGRKKMISLTYTLSAVLLFITGLLFIGHRLSALTQTLCWAIVFFFSSASASSAYLTIAEVFPVEIRALSIALFFSLGTGIGGVTGPALFGSLEKVVATNRLPLFWGYVSMCVIMVVAAIVEQIYGVDAEGKSLEDLAKPIAAE